MVNKTMNNKDEQDFLERVVTINRVTKVVKGGRRFSFSALVVAGDGNGHVGRGIGKANEVPESIGKATRMAKKFFMEVPLKEHRTIPYPVIGRFGASRVVLKPASSGTGVIAGGPVRAVLECVGVKDILTKRLGSRNPHNVVHAALNGLRQLRDLSRLRDGKPVKMGKKNQKDKNDKNTEDAKQVKTGKKQEES